MFRVKQSNILADRLADFLDGVMPQGAIYRPQLVAIDDSPVCAKVADDSLYMQRRRRARRSRVASVSSSVKTSWY